MFTRPKYDFPPSTERAACREPLRLKMNPHGAVPFGTDVSWRLNSSWDRTPFIPPHSIGLNSTTTRDAMSFPSHVESTVMSDGSMVCGDPVTFPLLRGAGPHRHPLQQNKSQVESPAKVFAKLKSKVQTGAMCGNEGFQVERDIPFRAKEMGRAEFNSPRKIREDTWTADMPKENQRFNFANEAEALTLSPTQSPRKTLSCALSGSKTLQGMSPVKDVGIFLKPRNGHTQPKRRVLEPAAGFHPHSLVNTKPIQRPSPLIRDLDDCKMTHRTPVKVQPPNLSTEGGDGRNVPVEACVFLDKRPLMSPAKTFAHMKRERKRTWEQQESYTERNNGGFPCHSQARPTSTAVESHNSTSMVVFNSLQGSSFSAQQSEMNSSRVHATDSLSDGDASDETSPPAVKRRPVPIEDVHPRDSAQTHISKQRCFVELEELPQMSPTKMFAYIKEKERKRQHQEVYQVSSSTRVLRSRGHSCQSQDGPTSTTSDKGETEDDTRMDAFHNDQQRESPADQSRLEPADSQSDADPRGDIMLPALKPQPPLVEDPVVLDSPRITIPKKCEATFKCNRWPVRMQFPETSVVYLKKWVLRCTRNGLYVDGVRKDDNTPWHSNIIMETISSSVLKTVSGRVYVLVGKMNMEIQSELPRWLLRKFVHGFPSNWKMYYEKFLSESADLDLKEERNNDGRSTRARPVTPATTLCAKRHREKPVKTSASCPPPSSASFLIGGTKVSRSGRVIKPPLEYWKGGRVILDADMNVTIHECYDTSICNPPMDTPVSTRMPQKPAKVSLPRSQGCQQDEVTSTSSEPSVPLRKVKTTHHKRNRAKAKLDKKSLEVPETLIGPEQRSDRIAGQRSPPPEATCTDSIPQSGLQPDRHSTHRSKKQSCLPETSSVRVLMRKRTPPTPAEPPTGTDRASQSDDEFSSKRKRRGKPRKRRGKKALDESQSSHQSPSSQPSNSSEDSGMNLRKRTAVSTKSDAKQKSKVRKQNQRHDPSPPPKPAPQPTQSRKKINKGNKNISTKKVIPQEKDEDEWTEAELVRLQEAVSSCPKHMGSYWVNVAMIVGTRSAEECQKRHTSQGTFQALAKRAKKSKKEDTKKEPAVDPTITARVGTLRRKQQVRQFLEAMPKDDLDDVFSSSSMQSQRFQLPSMTPTGKDRGLTFMDLEPLTPMTTGVLSARTPQCLHITPGMMGSPNRNNDDKYIYQLQKRMKKNQFNVYKHSPNTNFSPTPSVKRAMRRCGTTENDTFVVWEMFPDNEEALAESGEEDFYFSDND
ncbi:mis18-binding protein 1 [Myripristis murdjan]|uniref:SANTA domain-containing protein n=1 Tax=Myripristis murdjan TaxID=586833 RepID=A0A668AQB5_9TELE|nr:mis18-binding protein 1 [Myripristis murdjan]